MCFYPVIYILQQEIMLKYQAYCFHPHFFHVMHCTLSMKNYKRIKEQLVRHRNLLMLREARFENSGPKIQATQIFNIKGMRKTCKAIFKQVSRMGGLRRIKLHTALRPWVTLSTFNVCDSFSILSPFPGEHMFSKIFKTDFGK